MMKQMLNKMLLNILKINNLFLILILILLSGCIATKDGDTLTVQGVGLDTTFYPVFSIRCGYYKYTIVKDNGDNNSKTIIIK